MEIPNNVVNDWTIQQINELFSAWDRLKYQDRVNIIKQCRTLGKITHASMRLEDKGYRCPIYGFPVIKPCNLDSCRNNIASPENKNCATILLENSKNQRVPNTVMSQIFGMSCSDLTKIHNRAAEKIRFSLLREKLAEYNPYKFQYIPKHCVSCGQSMHEEWDCGVSPSLVIEPYKWGYCSDNCRRIKPKWMFYVENQFGYHYRTVLEAAYSIYGNTNTVDQTLGVPAGTTTHYYLKTKNNKK